MWLLTDSEHIFRGRKWVHTRFSYIRRQFVLDTFVPSLKVLKIGLDHLLPYPSCPGYKIYNPLAVTGTNRCH